MPTVLRLPLVAAVTFAPGGPTNNDPPDLQRFRLSPGRISVALGF
jgi:hypothetical protein